MVGVENEDLVHGAGEHRIDLVFLAWHRKAHVEEVRRIGEAVLGINERLSNRIFKCHGGDGRQLGDHPSRGDLTLLGIADIGRVVVEGGERANHADHHRHRMGIAAEAAEELAHLLMHHRVMGDGVFEFLAL